ncbi:MAG: tetratricopeptide repeat protein, partial [Chloroflexi bacterium]|nr:tetratricopeptide repeat protein [Chloroflexota bacterium]
MLRPSLSRHFRVAEEAEKLDPERDLDIQNYQTAYQSRGIEDEIAKKLGKCKSLVIVGKPMMGKTRLCYEVLRTLKGWYVLYPRAELFRHQDIDWSVLKGKRVILFLNDLHKYVDKFDPLALQRDVQQSTAVCAMLANCRDGPELELVKDKWGWYYATLEQMNLNERGLSEYQAEKLAHEVGKEWTQAPFDGSPGSILLGLGAMAERYHRLAPQEQAILRAVKLLHYAGIDKVDQNLAQAVCERIWDVHLRKYQWSDLWKRIERSSFVALGESPRIRVCDPYLQQCVTDYQRPQEDFPKLFGLLVELWGARGLYSLGDANFRAGRLPEALLCFEEVLLLEPDNADVHDRYAKLLKELGRKEEAEKEYRKALRLEPDNADAHYWYAEFLKELGRKKEAEKEYREALRFKPDDAWSHYDYAIFLR